MTIWLVLNPEAELYNYIHDLFEGDRLPVSTPHPCVVIQGEPCFVLDSQQLTDAQIAGLAEPLYQKYKDDPEMSRQRARLEVLHGMPISQECCRTIIIDDMGDTKQLSPSAVIPLYWMQETSGKLREAIETYIHYRANKNHPKPTERHLLLMQAYFKQWINAPAYDQGPGDKTELLALRNSVEKLDSIQDINRWLDRAFSIGIDPL